MVLSHVLPNIGPVVLVNLAFRQSLMTTGTGDSAYLVFIAFYVVCVVVTWVVYLRPQARMAGV